MYTPDLARTSESTIMNFMHRVYGWMAGALAITAATAYYVASSPAIYTAILEKPFVLLLFFLIQIGLVIALSGFITKLSYTTAIILFILYSISMGITLSAIFLAYTSTSIFVTFLITAGMFGAMSLYGYFTKTDLSRMGNILLMGLVGIIIASLVNLWFKNSTVEYIISLGGVAIFTLLTAYDTQNIKRLGSMLISQGQSLSKVALLGALTLYLDFINLFLFLLRFTGSRRES